MKSFRELYDLDAGVSIGRANPPTSAPSVIVLARSSPLCKPPDAIIGVFTELRVRNIVAAVGIFVGTRIWIMFRN